MNVVLHWGVIGDDSVVVISIAEIFKFCPNEILSVEYCFPLSLHVFHCSRHSLSNHRHYHEVREDCVVTRPRNSPQTVWEVTQEDQLTNNRVEDVSVQMRVKYRAEKTVAVVLRFGCV